MNKIFFPLAALCLLSTASLPSIESKENSAVSCPDERYYVDPENILLNEKGIFANFNGTFVPVEVLGADDVGIYCEKFKAGFLMMCPKGHVYEMGVQRALCPHYRYR